MKRYFLVVVVLAWALSIAAQTAKPPESITEVNVSVVKPGMVSQWEQGRKRHSEFHRTQKDTWTVQVYEVLSGDAVGNFISVQPGHNWKDFDARAEFDKLDAPDVAKNMGPYDNGGPRSFYVYRADLSRSKEGGAPSKMVTVAHYWLLPDHVSDFQDAVKAINAAIDKASYPVKPSRWYQLANGGDVPHFVLVTERAGWADLEPPAQTMQEALGPEGAQAIDKLRKSTKRIYTEMLEYRADLSYVPSK
jgi:hypothetical protein